MTRGVFLIIVVICGVLLVVDAHVLSDSLDRQGLPPTNWLFLAVALLAQGFAVAGATWYIVFMSRSSEVYGLHFSEPVSSRLKLLPFIFPGLLAVASVALLHKAVQCGNQPLLPLFTKPLCARASAQVLLRTELAQAPNPSIEATAQSPLRALWSAPHVKRLVPELTHRVGGLLKNARL